MKRKKRNQKRKNGKKQVSAFPCPTLLTFSPLQFDFLGNGIRDNVLQTFLKMMILCQYIGISSLRKNLLF